MHLDGGDCLFLPLRRVKTGIYTEKKKIHLPRLTATDNGVRRASGLCWLCLRNGTRRLRGRQGSGRQW